MISVSDSARLSFQLMGAEDAHALWSLDQDPLVMRFLNGGKFSSMQTINDVFLPRMLSYRDPIKGFGIRQVLDKISHEYLGWILVRPMAFFTEQPDFTDIELGWRFFQSAWEKVMPLKQSLR